MILNNSMSSRSRCFSTLNNQHALISHKPNYIIKSIKIWMSDIINLIRTKIIWWKSSSWHMQFCNCHSNRDTMTLRRRSHFLKVRIKAHYNLVSFKEQTTTLNTLKTNLCPIHIKSRKGSGVFFRPVLLFPWQLEEGEFFHPQQYERGISSHFTTEKRHAGPLFRFWRCILRKLVLLGKTLKKAIHIRKNIYFHTYFHSKNEKFCFVLKNREYRKNYHGTPPIPPEENE